MSLKQIYSAFINSDPFLDAAELLTRYDDRPQTVRVRGLSGSLPAFLVAGLQRDQTGISLCVLPDPETAAYFFSDLQQVLRDGQPVLFFPPSDSRPFDPEHVPNPGPAIARNDTLERLKNGFSGIIVTDASALSELVPAEADFEDLAVRLGNGDTVAPSELIEDLVSREFTRVEFVERPGELALRGGIMDIFPFTGDYPVRVEFFGDEIDSIREFDIHTQRSVSRRTSCTLVPNLSTGVGYGRRVCLCTYLGTDFRLYSFEETLILEEIGRIMDEAVRQSVTALPEENTLPAPDKLFLSAEDFLALTKEVTHIRLGTFSEDAGDETFVFSSLPQPSFNGSIAALRSKLAENSRQGIQTRIACDSRGQEGRILELLDDDLERFRVSVHLESLHEGFEIPSLGLAVYTDHQIFNRYHRPTARRRKAHFGGLSLRELGHLVPGDFVVHIDYGVGKFAGLEKIEVRGKQQEVVRLSYDDGDVLYVNVNALYKLHKYKGKEGAQPRLTRLGSGQWERIKSRTKSHVKDIARDLISLYASRKAAGGFEFSEDSVWQRELEASFQFEDTPDQAAAAQAVKEDMISPMPMDRLVCGDVGFGKTEIAVRAAFKAVQDGKQVAVLVPTTILAMQHERTFNGRLGAYPVQIEILSRFRTGAHLKEAIRRIATGEADIVIGTHRLISKDVKFKNLGLLIIDEEQRFGVSVKEKLRQMRVNVDTLTLTATPIPRTLQFSLLGARDLSIIATPPPNRQPIVTEIHTFDHDLIRDAILNETARGGQVFFIHNRIQSIQEISDLLRMLIPDLRIQVGHGQMTGSQLERVMKSFYERKCDVLVSTNIIENGLDISNANTIIINRADHFGLAELHQLRGRVGRSDRKAFCYLLVPSVRGLTREARQRLQAVEEFSDLGSGIHIAMRDLDIRGAGNLLGAEQTGFISDVGFETYHRILDEAVAELQTEEFSDLYGEKPPARVSDTSIEVEADALIPEFYLSNRLERLNLYRRISDIKEPEGIQAIRDEIMDRFGPFGQETENLFLSAEIKILAARIRLVRVVFKNCRLFLGMPSHDGDPWFYENLFQPLLRRLQNLDHRYVLRDSKSGRLRAIIQDVNDLEQVLAILNNVQVTAAEPVPE